MLALGSCSGKHYVVTKVSVYRDCEAYCDVLCFAVMVVWVEPERALPLVFDAQLCWPFKIDWTVYFEACIL